MAERVELTLYENNDEEVSLAVTALDGGGPYDLTDADVELIIKPSAEAESSAPGAVTLSTTSGEVTIDSAVDGTATAVIDRSHLAEAGTRVWRLDVVRSGTRRTAMYGPLHVMDL